MSQQLINLGAAANDGTGTNARDGGAIINSNFTEIYGRVADLEETQGVTSYNDLTDKPFLGTASSRNVGTAEGQLIEVLAGQKLPALDGSNLINLPSGGGGGGGSGITITGVPSTGQIARWTSTTSLEGFTDTSGALALTAVQPARQVIAGTGTTGGGDLSADRTIALSSDTLTSLGKADTAIQPSRTLTAGTGIATIGDLSADRTIALSSSSITSLGKADTALQTGDDVKAAVIALSTANVLDFYNDIAAQGQFIEFKLPYVGGVPPAFSAGDIFTVGAALGTNVYEISLADTDALDQTPNSFVTINDVGSAVSTPYQTGEAWGFIQQGRPYAIQPTAFASNVLTLDSGTYRAFKSGTITANSTIAASSWNNIYEFQEPVRLLVPVGGTAYTLLPAVGADGYRINTIPTFDTDSIQEFALSRVDGVPSLRWVASYPNNNAVASNPSYIDSVANTALTTTTTWSLNLGTLWAPGDLAVAIVHSSSSSQPPVPTSQGVSWTDAGIGTTDGQANSIRLVSKVLVAGDTTIDGGVGTSTVYVAIFRKPGSNPSLALTSYYKQGSSATTTLTWVTLAMAQNCLLLGADFFLGNPSDDAPLRGELVVVKERATASQKSHFGVSALLVSGTDSIGATTTAKTGVVSRAIAVQAVIY